MPASFPAPLKDVVRDSHTVEFRASAHDSHWVGVGGPATGIELDVIAFTMDWDADRVPVCRATLVCAPPAGMVRWLSPLHRSCFVYVLVRYTGPDGNTYGGWHDVVTLHLRRRTLDHRTGQLTLDLATYDQEVSDYYAKMEVAT